MANNITNKIVKIKRLSEQAVMPVKSTTGYILFSPKTMILPAWTRSIMVPMDLAFTVPLGVLFKMAPIPGIAWQTRHRILGEVVLPCEEQPQVVSLTMLNDTDNDIEIKAGDPIGQLIMYCDTTTELVEEIDSSKNPRLGQDVVNDGPKRARTKD